MNKKGFTMIELLMVIAILGLLSLILVPGVIEMSNQNNIKSCQSLKKNIISAAKIYVTENKYELGFDCENNKEKTVSIDTLVETGKLKGPVINPIDKSKVSEDIVVNYDCDAKSFTYTFSLCEKNNK